MQVADADFFAQALDHGPRLLPLLKLADHREHDPQRSVPRCAQQSTQLALHHLWTLQGQANATHPEERVFFLGYRPIRQRLVTAHVQGAHDQWPTAEAVEDTAVLGLLQCFVRGLLMGHENQFRAQ
ncbi:hypothetical protein D3C77_314640 [compost metagenome]